MVQRTGNRTVLKLLAKNPFPDAPPKFLRSELYQYRFAPLNEKGVWWSRTIDSEYCPDVTLGADGRMQVVEQ